MRVCLRRSPATEIADVTDISSDLMGRAFPPCPGSLDVNLLGYGEGVVNLDAQIPHCALDLCVAEQQLDGPEVSRASVNQCCLGPAQRVRAIQMRVQPDSNEPI